MLIGIVAAIFAAIGIFLIVDSVDEWDRLRSLLGISILFGLGYAFSANRKHVTNPFLFAVKSFYSNSFPYMWL